MLREFRLLIVVLFSVLFQTKVLAQTSFNQRFKTITMHSDTITLDTLSLVPGSFTIKYQGQVLDTVNYRIQELNARLRINPEWKEKEITVEYKVLPYNLSQPAFHKKKDLLLPDRNGLYNPYVYTYKETNENLFKQEGLNKNGSIARGLTFGNNQNVVVNSNLNLQLSGKLSENIEVLAAITDDNIPFQPNGNTQQLQEFDKVFIQLTEKQNKLIAGDFVLNKPNSYFLNYYKRAQGLNASTTITPNPVRPNDQLTLNVAGAVSKGKFGRNIIQGIEGNQGPYRLKGMENEGFIIVLSGTEKVYIDGILLLRGQENDYTIDYNTSEVTFTAKRMITKDRRIVVEFQYSDKNYARSLITMNAEYLSDKFRAGLSVYNEQDNKNKPLQQQLNEVDKQVLAAAGDDINKAIAPGIDSSEFRSDIIMYARKDSMVNGTVYKNVYYYSANPDSAFFQLSFSNVGNGNGNYIQERTATNGRVFKWLAPQNGIKQGNFEPIVLLITPKQRQMIVGNAGWKPDSLTTINLEGAWSTYDKNTFSVNDSGDDSDLGLKINGKRNFPLQQKNNPWYLSTGINYEQVNKNFSAVERFRSVEFERDWNILNKPQSNHQYIGGLELGLVNKQKGSINWLNSLFEEPGDYKAKQSKLITNIRTEKWSIVYTGSYTNSTSKTDGTEFIRQKGSITRKIKWIALSLKADQEQNKFMSLNNDTLRNKSYRFNEWFAIISNSDTTGNRYSINYTERYDWGVHNNQYKRGTHAQGGGGSIELIKNIYYSVKINTSYRKLTILDSSLTSQKADNTLVNRIEYNLRLWKGLLSSTTFYEIGSGLELKKEYSFIQVAPGQGVYAWLDYNQNGLKELNEFEITPFPDQAQFIKVFTPTNQYIKTYSNQFNQSVLINPAVLIKNAKGFKKFISMWSNQFAYRSERKTTSSVLEEQLNPFYRDINDLFLQAVNSTFRNTLFFNKTGYLFGADYTWQDVNGKTLLVNGFDGKRNTTSTIRTRLLLHRFVTFNNEFNRGLKQNTSQLLTNRNYNVRYLDNEPKITLQTSPEFRLSLAYKYSEKKNDVKTDSTQTYLNKITSEIRINRVNKGSWQGNISYYLIKFRGDANSPLGFEMLEGLRPGTNLTWNINYQQNITSSLQISLNYSGRKPEGLKTIHTGNVTVRAIF